MKTASAYKALWDGDKQFLSAIAKEVATLVAVPENMDYFRKQITEFADKWRAYKTAYEADSKRKWQPSMGRPKNPLGTIWPLVYGSGWKDGEEKFLPDGPGIYLLPYYPCYDIKVALGACALLAVIQDNILPNCPPIAKDVLPKKLSQEIWRNLITGVGIEDTIGPGPRSVIQRHKIAGFLIDVRADIGQDATALSGIEKIYFNKYSPAYKELWSRTEKNDDEKKSESAKDAVSNAAKNNPTPQTQEQQLAIQIINALSDWASVGADNWDEKLPKEYHPNHCLGYRLSIHNKLGINPILEKLMLEGRGDAAKMLEQYRDILDKAVNAINENLDTTSPMHLPNTELSIHAGNLSKALERALPYLGTQPAKGHVQADFVRLKTAETEQKERPLLQPSDIKLYVDQIETPRELLDFLKEGYERIYDSWNFGNEPSFFDIIRKCVFRIREKHLSLNLPPDPNGYDIVAYENWCVDAQRAIDATTLTKTEPVSTKQNIEKTVPQIIEQGEGQTIEFKETLEYSVREKKQDTNLNKECLKTIVAFLNTDGGTLLIGVRDNGEITGIERDLSYVQRKNEDGFQLKLRNLIKNNFTPIPSGKIDISFEKHAKETICRVDVEPVNKNQIIHLGKDVYIRDGNITRKLEGRDLTDWIQQRGK